GGVSVHSLSKSEGAVIELFFPQTGIDESELSAEDDTSSRRASDRKPGVLFIDDDPLVCAVTERILARKGFVVHTAESGAQGLDLYQSKKDDIAVAIIDLNMPDMNGEQVVQQMLKLGLLVPVVATSGADEQLDAAYLRQVGFCDIISKPYSAGDLADKINHVLQQAVH
ncbi:MAG TPA: response regulator, partial [Bacteroidetes bacterium]|nr:response regulator [Bacteroidota bacterium]